MVQRPQVCVLLMVRQVCGRSGTRTLVSLQPRRCLLFWPTMHQSISQTCVSLPAAFVRVGKAFWQSTWEICARESLAELGMAVLLPLLLCPCHHTLLLYFFPCLCLRGAAILYSLNNFTFSLSVPALPTTAFKDKILLSNDPEYYQLIDKDPQSS